MKNFTYYLSIMLPVPLFALSVHPPRGSDIELIAPPSEYNLERFAVKREVEAFTIDLAGKNTSLTDGLLSFSVNDLSINTNSQSPLNITRTYKRLTGKMLNLAQFGDWQLKSSKIEATYLRYHNFCSDNYFSWGLQMRLM